MGAIGAFMARCVTPRPLNAWMMDAYRASRCWDDSEAYKEPHDGGVVSAFGERRSIGS